MRLTTLKATISLVCAGFVAVHLLVPAITIDTVLLGSSLDEELQVHCPMRSRVSGAFDGRKFITEGPIRQTCRPWLAFRQRGEAGGDSEERMLRYLMGAHHPQQALRPRVMWLALQTHSPIGYAAGHLTRRSAVRASCNGSMSFRSIVAPRLPPHCLVFSRSGSLSTEHNASASTLVMTRLVRSTSGTALSI